MNAIEALEKQYAEAVKASKEAFEHETHVRMMLDHARSDTCISHDGSPTHCRTCGADVSTEALFNSHYVIPDYRYHRIGHCPSQTM